LNSLISIPNFFKDESNSKKVLSELKRLKTIVNPWLEANNEFIELNELLEIVEEKDDKALHELEKDSFALLEKIEKLDFNLLFCGEFDANNTILSINAGAGGTESCDWVSMLLRMYVRFAERKGFKTKVIDLLEGEEAGIKNVTIFINGVNSFGFLKAERGVHRLVRISPFDSNKRRHTSFASVDVIPEIEDNIEVVLDEKDLKVDVYRASGKGGQGVNTTDSAVRITHLPTGIVVTCQNERSQFQNKQNALKVLRARIYEKMQLEQEAKLQKQGSDKRKIEWGSQIRSYVIHPYSMVKDHRTKFETSNVQAVMDGDLEGFIFTFLKQQKNINND